MLDISENINVFGSNQLLKGSTSCDLGEKIGDEWIIFGYTNKKRFFCC